MQAYIVTVRSRTGERYKDSLWLKKSSAETRARRLRDEFIREGYATKIEVGYWWCWISEVDIEDAVLAEASAPASESLMVGS